MTYRYCGICGKCGSATYVPEVWHGIFPPRPECIDCNRKSPDVKAPTMESVRQEIKETKDIVEKIRQDRHEFEKRVFFGNNTIEQTRPAVDTSFQTSFKEMETRRAVASLASAVTKSLGDVEGSRLDDLEARVNRLEMMMISASEQLTNIREAVNCCAELAKSQKQSPQT